MPSLPEEEIMLKKYITGLALVLLLMSCSSADAEEVRSIHLPVPQTVSRELQELISAAPPSWWKDQPDTSQEWKAWVREKAEVAERSLPALRKRLGVTVESGQVRGVRVFTVIPSQSSEKLIDCVLLHFHGGGYVLNPGEAGTTEAIYMAGIGGVKVVSVDYRMPPDFPYPAAMDDALAVYRGLLEEYPPEKIGVFGTSTGGGMTLALMLRAREEGLPLPGAIAPGTPWSDMTKTGDSYFTNEGVDNVLVSYDGWLEAAARLYANGRDLHDPMLSPVYGNVAGFPPTLLTSGTRDLFLSNTVRMHLKLREAGVDADLMVFEGLSHAQYGMSGQAPETIFHFKQLSSFFEKHLK